MKGLTATMGRATRAIRTALVADTSVLIGRMNRDEVAEARDADLRAFIDDMLSRGAAR